MGVLFRLRFAPFVARFTYVRKWERGQHIKGVQAVRGDYTTVHLIHLVHLPYKAILF
jgi:hypothetical protein